MTNLTKSAALAIASESVELYAANRAYAGTDAAELAKFERLSMAIIAKGERLGDDFFGALPDDINDGILKRGTAIVRAIHAATKEG